MLSNLKNIQHYLSSHQKPRLALVIGLLTAGVIARFGVMQRGFNFDMDSWRIVADILNHHGNVYAETYRYNYGPLWFGLLHVFDRVASFTPNPYHFFRYFLVGFLILVDLGVWALLKKQFGYIVAFLFFLNPISIIITGYHNQFDNFAILLALAAVMIYGRATGGLTRRKLAGLALLGISIMTKHLFFAFPLWLAVKQKGWKEKLVTLLLPIAIFLVGFVPFLAHGRAGIVHNVFEYASFNNAPFWFAALPPFLHVILGFKLLFFGALFVFAFVVRKLPVLESLLMYTLVMVIFSPAIANQYLVIAAPAIAVFFNAFFGLYMAYSGVYLAIDAAGLHSQHLNNVLPGFVKMPITQGMRSYDVLILLLAFGLAWHFWKEHIKQGARFIGRWVRDEIKFQLKTAL